MSEFRQIIRIHSTVNIEMDEGDMNMCHALFSKLSFDQFCKLLDPDNRHPNMTSKKGLFEILTGFGPCVNRNKAARDAVASVDIHEALVK